MSKAYISAELRRETRLYFQERCAYCRSPESLIQVFYEIDHIVPEVAGGPTESGNLALTCPICNRFKASQQTGHDPVTGRQVALFHPRRQNWFRHFAWSSDSLSLYGRTICGRATVEALRLNNERLVTLRQIWIQIGASPPDWDWNPSPSGQDQ